jgi:hypothetical protein
MDLPDHVLGRPEMDPTGRGTTRFTDHIIQGDRTMDPAGKGWYSFREAGLV